MFNASKYTPKNTPYKVGAGGSLYLHVMPNGSKYWRLKYSYEGKQKTYAIGVYPDISFGAAQDERDKAKALLKRGIDPVAHRREAENERIRHANKPENHPNSFSIAINEERLLTIETAERVINLNKKEAKAVYAFLDNIFNEGNNNETF